MPPICTPDPAGDRPRKVVVKWTKCVRREGAAPGRLDSPGAGTMKEDAFVTVSPGGGLPDWLAVAAWLDKPGCGGVAAGISLRGGGVSTGPWTSLNLALHVGDEADAVLENRRRLSLAAGFAPEAWTCAEQTHENRVRLVTASDRGAGRLSRETAFPATDALITREAGILLVTFHADCVPIFFFDPARRAVGLAHAGWRGTASRVAIRTVEAMEEAFGTRPGDLLAAIGPSIGPCCYEVGEDVAGAIGVPEATREAGGRAGGRFLLDLKEANRQFMIKAGLAPNRIEVSGYCTCCRTDLFFSHRGEGGRTGRLAAFIGIGTEREHVGRRHAVVVS